MPSRKSEDEVSLLRIQLSKANQKVRLYLKEILNLRTALKRGTQVDESTTKPVNHIKEPIVEKTQDFQAVAIPEEAGNEKHIAHTPKGSFVEKKIRKPPSNHLARKFLCEMCGDFEAEFKCLQCEM